MNQSKRNNRWDKRIAFINDHYELLNGQEQDFMVSIETKRDLGFDLSPREVSKLYEIYHKVDQNLG